MKMIIKVGLLFCLFLSLCDGQKQSFSGDKVYHLYPESEEQLKKIDVIVKDFELDLWKEARFIGDNVDVRVPLIHQNQFNVFLATQRIRNEVFIDDVQKLINEQARSRARKSVDDTFNYQVYHTLDEIQSWMSEMEAENSDLITEFEVGRSFEDRSIRGIKIGAGPDSNPKFVMNCGIHAREWISPATCLLTTRFLVDGYRNNDAFITNVLNSIQFIFVPSLNVDGYSYTWTDDRLWRKTRTSRPDTFCVGADPNRNWDINFEGRGSTNIPCDSTYRGLYPFSENCTAAQKDMVNGLDNVHVYIDLHSYSQLWMHPYGYKAELAGTHDILLEIGEAAVAAVLNTHQKVYTPGPIYSVLYPASGTVTDYFYEVTGVPCSYLVELRDTGEHGFLLPEEQIMPTAEEAFAGFMVLTEAILDNKCAMK